MPLKVVDLRHNPSIIPNINQKTKNLRITIVLLVSVQNRINNSLICLNNHLIQKEEQIKKIHQIVMTKTPNPVPFYTLQLNNRVFLVIQEKFAKKKEINPIHTYQMQNYNHYKISIFPIIITITTTKITMTITIPKNLKIYLSKIIRKHTLQQNLSQYHIGKLVYLYLNNF